MAYGSRPRIVTFKHKNTCSYIVLIDTTGPSFSFKEDMNIEDYRITFIERSDNNSENNLVITKDFVINPNEFIIPFNKLLHKIYDENKHYLNKEYEEKPEEEITASNYKNILADLKNTIDILDKQIVERDYPNQSFDDYLYKPIKYEKEDMEQDIETRKEWKGERFLWAADLEKYFNSIKDKIIGTTIDRILISIYGNLYGRDMWDEFGEYKNGKWYKYGEDIETDEPGFYYPFKTENTALDLDGPIILCFGDTNLEIDYWQGSVAHIAQNTLDTENDCLMDLSVNFSKNIIGHKLADIQIRKTDKVYFMDFLADREGIKRKDGDDMFGEIWFIFDNGYKLEIVTNGCDYMTLNEVK